MLKIYGIIAEFNPFHNGHALLCKRAREHGADGVVAVMSGNYVQRGDIAVTDKRVRAHAAIKNGVDLVLEIPLPWAMAPASTFARGGVSLLQSLGCVDTLFFGSECGDISLLRKTAEAVGKDGVKTKIRDLLHTGITYAAAREKAVEAICGKEISGVLAAPNNILAVEYLIQMQEQKWQAQAITIPREGTAHDSSLPGKGFASASYLRSNPGAWNSYIPHSTIEIYHKARQDGLLPANAKTIEPAILAHLRRLTPAELSTLPDLSEGLEKRLYKAIRIASSLDELHTCVKSKRYPMARIRRLVLAAFLDLKQDDAAGTPPYLRILAMSKDGEAILSKANPVLPLHTSLIKLGKANDACKRIADIEAAAGDIYALSLPAPLRCGFEYTTGAIFQRAPLDKEKKK